MTADVVTPRRAGPADAAAVRELSRAAYAKWVPLIGREPLPMTADYDRAVVEHVIDLWEDSGGALVASVEMVPGDGFLLIENIAVRPDRQGEGFGAMVLRHAESLARDLGLPEIRLYTNARFVSNIDFYARRGFREFRREELVPGNVAVHMSKRTDPSG